MISLLTGDMRYSSKLCDFCIFKLGETMSVGEIDSLFQMSAVRVRSLPTKGACGMNLLPLEMEYARGALFSPRPNRA